MGEVRALHERPVLRVRRVAVDLGELRPVRDPHRRVDRPARREADERGDGGADALDRLAAPRGSPRRRRPGSGSGHLTPSQSVARRLLLSSFEQRVRRGRRRRAAARALPGSRTSISVSSRAQRITFACGAARRTCSRERRRAVAVEVEHDGVRLQPRGLRHDPSRLVARRRSRRRRRPRARLAARRAMIGSRSPSRHASRRPSSTRTSLSAPARAAATGQLSGSLGCPFGQLLAAALRRGASRRSRGRRARPGPSSVASASPPSAVRATTRCVPGRIRSKRKRPSRRVTVQRPASGSATQASGDRLAVGVADACRRAGAARCSVPRGPVGEPRAHRLRPHLRARARASRRTRPRA